MKTVRNNWGGVNNNKMYMQNILVFTEREREREREERERER